MQTFGIPDCKREFLFQFETRKMSVGGEGRVNGHPGEVTGEERGPHSGHSSIQYCCLLENGRPCNRPASNASYSKRIQGIVAQIGEVNDSSIPLQRAPSDDSTHNMRKKKLPPSELPPFFIKTIRSATSLGDTISWLSGQVSFPITV